MDVVSPAADVFTVSGVLGNQSVDFSTGTSFAAPLVSGAAAAALALDPTLSAVQLRDLIVESSRDSVVDERSGSVVAKAPVCDGVYILNVFNLLRRVSNRSGALPLCGQPVESNPDQRVICISRPGGALELPYPGEPLPALAVAPGGRRIAAACAPTSYTDGRAFEYQLGSSGWARGTDRLGISQIHYADGDTFHFRIYSADQTR